MEDGWLLTFTTLATVEEFSLVDDVLLDYQEYMYHMIMSGATLRCLLIIRRASGLLSTVSEVSIVTGIDLSVVNVCLMCPCVFSYIVLTLV